MCFVTKKTHQKAIDDLEKKYDHQIGVLHSKLTKQWENMMEYSDAGNRTDLANHRSEYHTIVDPPTAILFDPKTEPYPTEIGGMKLSFVRAKDFCCLWGADKDNVLYPYQDDSWGNNTEAKRIMVNPSRAAVAVNKEGDVYGYDPRPFGFDGGDKAYEVCPDQAIDGKYIWAITENYDPPNELKLYIRLEDVEAL